MNVFDLFLIAVGLSMDAFAVSICAGLTMPKATLKKCFTVGAYFGVFQAAMPLIGFFAATRFASMIENYDHWVAFVLLIFLGGRMIKGSFEKDEDEGANSEEASLAPSKMLPLAVATSIDAMAVGVMFAFQSNLSMPIQYAVLLIGATTLLISVAGVKIGKAFGMRFKSKAELAGGVILALIGVKILLEALLA
jgi:putative Mn2+ efflux pump MntP